jgi:hypothetical protein
MHCRTIQRKLSQLPTREIPVGVLSEHLSGCPACASAHARFRDILDAVESDRINEASPWFITRLEARLDKQKIVDYAGVFRLKPIAVTLMVVFPLMTGIWLGYNTFTNNRQHQQDYELIAEVNNLLTTPGYGADSWFMDEE